jgi:sulfonate transport system ATP-binding protein
MSNQMLAIDPPQDDVKRHPIANFDASLSDALAVGVSLTARGLKKNFGSKQVLKGLDLYIPSGQFLAIVGRSGGGKSTLLRLLAGLDQVSGGTFSFEHEAFSNASVRNASGIVRVMFQEPRLLPWARVQANVEVGLGPLAGTAESKYRALRALGAVGLEDRAHEWPAILSGGQKQRVALARALVSRPRLMALDEPLGALDALTRIVMQQLLERLWLRDGFTALLVTHDVAEALTLADRVVVIENGILTLDVPITLPRPRRRGSAEFAKLEEQILERLLRESDAPLR